MVEAMGAAILVAAVGLLGSIVTNAFFYGKLTQKVSSNSDDISELQRTSLDHEKRISHLEGPTRWTTEG